MNDSSLTRYAWLSIAAALITITLKLIAYALTHSVGLLSDALESVVNLVAAIMGLAMLTIAQRPADEDHAYGHSKAEYFASVVEGSLIMVAAGMIIWTASRRLADPQALQRLDWGLLVSVIASAVNLTVARVLLRAARHAHSITLEADATHLMTDVWTSAGVLVGIGLVMLTGWTILDPIIAMLVALNIIWAGVQLVRRSVSGLMDTALPAPDRAIIVGILDGYRIQGIEYHALRTRDAGARRFVSFHVLVPGDWSVQQGHHLVETMAAAVAAALPRVSVFTHLESLDDPESWMDIDLPPASIQAGGAAGPPPAPHDSMRPPA